MVAVKDFLLDVLKHSNNEFFETVKVESVDNTVNIFSSDNDHTMILNGKLKSKIDDDNLNGTFGLGSLNYLRGVTQWEPFRSRDAELVIERKTDRSGEEIPENIVFKNTEESAIATYRLMHKSMIKPAPVFKSNDGWDIDITPTKEKVDEFAQLAALLGDYEDQYIVKVENGVMTFYIGEEGAASHKIQMTFATDVEGSFSGNLRWPIRHMLYCLKLSLSGESKLRINKKGIINVNIDSGLMEYDFYLIAHSK